MFPCRRRGAACLLLLAIVCVLSCVGVAAARPAPTTTLHGRTDHHGGAVSRYSFFPGKPRWVRLRRPMVLTYALSKTATVGYLPRDAMRAVLQSAFARWAEVIPVSFAETEHYDAADITVGFYAGEHGDGSPFDGPLQVYAHATGPEDGHVHFDATERWTVDLSADMSPLAVDLESVATHEIGHALGLGHSPSSLSSVMYPYINPRERKVRLSVDDVEGIQELYGVNPNFSFTKYFKTDHETPSSRFWRLGIAFVLLMPF